MFIVEYILLIFKILIVIRDFLVNNKMDLEENIRLEAIKSMYQYKAKNVDHEIVPDTMEKIHNWYVDGIGTIERLAELFDVEKIYDSESIDLKIFLKDVNKF